MIRLLFLCTTKLVKANVIFYGELLRNGCLCWKLGRPLPSGANEHCCNKATIIFYETSEYILNKAMRALF